jgi:hypothetical protein
MRKDMNKVLTERPRVGGDDGQKHERTYKHKLRVRSKQYYKNIEVDDRPTKESMRKRHDRGGSSKSFSDHIKPLERYLLAQVGRPWDKVWSEICQVLKGTSLQANHVKDHVKGYVGGIPHSGQKYFAYNEWWNPRRNLVWVDENGILRKGEQRRRLRAKDLKKTYDHVRESDTVEYHKINGGWYRLEGWTKEEMSRYLRMPSLPGYIPSCKTKRALSKKEAKSLDLENRLSKYPPNLKP